MFELLPSRLTISTAGAFQATFFNYAAVKQSLGVGVFQTCSEPWSKNFISLLYKMAITSLSSEG